MSEDYTIIVEEENGNVWQYPNCFYLGQKLYQEGHRMIITDPETGLFVKHNPVNVVSITTVFHDDTVRVNR